MEDDKFEKYTVKCPNCGLEFLPWHCLSITDENTDWKTNCVCPNCNNSFNRDENFVNKC